MSPAPPGAAAGLHTIAFAGKVPERIARISSLETSQPVTPGRPQPETAGGPLPVNVPIAVRRAAAFTPTNRLDLGRWRPDFVVLSFYKIFGYPTGVGCLLARKPALAKLHRPWFAGGTITVASVQGDKHYLAEGEPAFEDGTLDYLALPAVEIGLRHIESLDVP